MSEEHTLTCDVPNCTHHVATTAGTARSEYGWGRCSVYFGEVGVYDYDLCPDHHRHMMAVLEGKE